MTFKKLLEVLPLIVLRLFHQSCWASPLNRGAVSLLSCWQHSKLTLYALVAVFIPHFDRVLTLRKSSIEGNSKTGISEQTEYAYFTFWRLLWYPRWFETLSFAGVFTIQRLPMDNLWICSHKTYPEQNKRRLSRFIPYILTISLEKALYYKSLFNQVCSLLISILPSPRETIVL